MSKDERLLEDAAMNQEIWSEATAEMFEDGWTSREQADYYGVAFADAVLIGGLALEELKAMATAANRLEKEAMEQAAGDIENLGDDDYIEAVARRIAHQSLRSAFDMVKTRDLLKRHQWGYLHRGGESKVEYIDPMPIGKFADRDSSGWLL